MAARGKKDGGVLRMGKLIGVFALLIAVFGGVFTLGYMLGRGQIDTQFHMPGFAPVHAGGAVAAKVPPTGDASDPDEPPPAAEPVRPVASAKPKAPAQPKAKPVAAPVESDGGSSASSASKPAKTTAPAARGPFIPRGATVLQVAALGRQADALALAQALQQKKFPAFVLNPSTDNYYRVQVGPYADTQSANAARHKLEAAGFNAIIKR
jgi:cell division septation protein DedD